MQFYLKTIHCEKGLGLSSVVLVLGRSLWELEGKALQCLLSAAEIISSKKSHLEWLNLVGWQGGSRASVSFQLLEQNHSKR